MVDYQNVKVKLKIDLSWGNVIEYLPQVQDPEFKSQYCPT